MLDNVLLHIVNPCRPTCAIRFHIQILFFLEDYINWNEHSQLYKERKGRCHQAGKPHLTFLGEYGLNLNLN